MEYSQGDKKKGWHSRQYQTAAAYLKSKEQRLEKESDYFSSLAQRAAKRKERTPQKQIEELDKRLAEFELDNEPGSSWSEVKARIVRG